jgi:hypothetical protein
MRPEALRELPVTGEHASADATPCLYKRDGESSASTLDRAESPAAPAPTTIRSGIADTISQPHISIRFAILI